MSKNKLAVVGTGAMGRAIIRSLLRAGTRPNAIIIRDKRSEIVEDLQSRYGVSCGNLAGARAIFLSIKPQDLEVCIKDISNELDNDVLVISVLAGVRSSRIESLIERRVRVIRVMPNLPLVVGAGMSVIARGKSGTEIDAKFVGDLLSKSGETLLVEEEVLDTVTAVSGSGPAYIYGFVEVMITAASKLGLTKKEAELLVRQTLIGATKMIQEKGKDVSELLREVTSPNGTTAAAMSSFEESCWGEIVYKAMKAARDRAQELSN